MDEREPETESGTSVVSPVSGRDVDGGVAERLGASGYREGPDGVELFYRCWEPEETRASLLALHGMAAHGEWLESLAASLLPRGVATVAPDLRGHGMTRWDLGKIPNPDLLLEDARFWVGELEREFAGLPLFVLGISLGGCLAVALAAGRSDLSGVILLSPAFRPTYLGWREKAGMSLPLLFGRDGGALTPLGRGLQICGDKLRLQWLRKDPLALSWLPARSHWNAQRLIRRARSRLKEVTAPMLCVQGALDPVVSPDANRRLLAGRKETRFVLWDEAYHDLALEANVEYLSGLLADWIRHHTAQPS